MSFYVLEIMIGLCVCATAIWFGLYTVRRNKNLTSVLNDAIDSSPNGLVFFDRDDVLIRKNRIAGNIIPALEEDIALLSLDGFLDYIFAHKSKTTAINQNNQLDEDGFLHDFQEVIESNDRTCLMQAKEFNTGETVIYLTDITEVKNKETQLFQAQKLEALGQLAGGVAHDFNNVLSIIDGYARMAQNYVEPEEEQLSSYLSRIRQASQRGAGLTRQLLLFGRHKIAEESVIDVERMIYDQERLLQPLLDSAVSLVIKTESGLFIDCMPDGLAQIIMNLVINARDAMPEGGTITVSTSKTDDETMLLSVTDTGVGMDPKIVARIFDPFFTTKDQGKGTGLGLSMVYGLVQDMNGKIDVDSRLGEGTSINITLPLSEKGVDKAIVETGDNDAGLRFEGYTALVAEDEPDLLNIVCDYLETLGMEVIKASNGAEALMKQDDFEGDIDFLLTDVVMPELNGVKLAELFQAVREETKIIFMSGFPGNGRLARIEIPEDAVLLAKPVVFEKLATVMKTVLDDDNLDAEESAIPMWQAAGG